MQTASKIIFWDLTSIYRSPEHEHQDRLCLHERACAGAKQRLVDFSWGPIWPHQASGPRDFQTVPPSHHIQVLSTAPFQPSTASNCETCCERRIETDRRVGSRVRVLQFCAKILPLAYVIVITCSRFATYNTFCGALAKKDFQQTQLRMQPRQFSRRLQLYRLLETSST